MILSNVELHAAIDLGRLVITPEPTPRTPEVGKTCPYDTHSVDLKLANEIVIPKSGQIAYDVTQPGLLADTIGRNSETITITEVQPYKLDAHKFILGRTSEKVELPIDNPYNNEHKRCLAARIEGKSSRARVGLLVHFTAPTVHPGYGGTLTLEMINLGSNPILLIPGMAIAQLIVEEVQGIPIHNPSQFQGQSAPEGVRLS